MSFALAYRMILPLVPMTFFSETFFRILEPIRNGSNWLIGGHAFVAPGVVVGDGSTVGVHAYIRRGKNIPPHSMISSLGGLDSRRIRELERHGLGTSGR